MRLWRDTRLDSVIRIESKHGHTHNLPGPLHPKVKVVGKPLQIVVDWKNTLTLRRLAART